MQVTGLYPQGNSGQMAIMASPGEGKSYAATYLHNAAPEIHGCPSVYFNYPQKEADNYEIPGEELDKNTTVQGPDKVYGTGEIVTRLLRQNELLKYKPDSSEEAMTKELRLIYERCKGVQGEVYLFVDEAHMVEQDSLERMMRDARGHRVHFICVTQYPTDLSNNAMSICEDQMVFELDNRQINYLKGIGVPVDAIKQRTKQPYSFVMFRKYESGGDKVSASMRLPSP